MKKENLKIAFGAHPSKEDRRNIKDPHLALGVPYPSIYETDISGMTGLLKLRYQKLLGVCVACAITTYVEYLYWKKTGKYTRLSVAFLYLVTKKLIDGNTEEGTSLHSGIKAAMKYGICTESTFPTNYDLIHTQFIRQPIPPEAYTEAINYTIGGYVSVPIDRSLFAAAIFKYGMLLTRMEVGSTWFTPSWLPKDIFPLKKPTVVISGHGIDHHEYDLTKEKSKFGFLNWWSVGWGNKGTGEHLMEDYEPTEAWALTLDSVMQYQDNSPVISGSIWKRLFDIFRSAGTLKAFIK